MKKARNSNGMMEWFCDIGFVVDDVNDIFKIIIFKNEAHFEELEGTWEDRYQKEYGYWRPYVLDVIYKYLDCCDLHLGFARVKCDDCNHEYLLPFSCKRRHFCPSCHQKRVVEFGEFLYGEVLKQASPMGLQYSQKA